MAQDYLPLLIFVIVAIAFSGIAVGVPARVIKYRFPSDVIEKLMATQ